MVIHSMGSGDRWKKRTLIVAIVCIVIMLLIGLIFVDQFYMRAGWIISTCIFTLITTLIWFIFDRYVLSASSRLVGKVLVG